MRNPNNLMNISEFFDEQYESESGIGGATKSATHLTRTHTRLRC